MAKTKNIDFIYETLRDLGETTAKQVQSATGLSSSTVTDNLRKLVDQGRVERREGFDAMAAGNGNVVLWRVLEQQGHDFDPDAEPERPVETIALPGDEPAERSRPRPADSDQRYADDLGPVLDNQSVIIVDEQRPESVADAIADDLPAHSVDLNVMAPQDETPADGHYATADDVDDRDDFDPVRADAEMGPVEMFTQPGGDDAQLAQDEPDDTTVDDVEQAHAEALTVVADDIAARTSSVPVSSDPGDVLAYMTAVRPVSPAPVGEPEQERPRRSRSTSTGEPRDTSGFFKRGQLSADILQWMRDHASESHGPGTVAKALGAQQGSVGYAMDKLVREGSLTLTQAKPKRYQATATS